MCRLVFLLMVLITSQALAEHRRSHIFVLTPLSYDADALALPKRPNNLAELLRRQYESPNTVMPVFKAPSKLRTFKFKSNMHTTDE